jgi:hypothetical protein
MAGLHTLFEVKNISFNIVPSFPSLDVCFRGGDAASFGFREGVQAMFEDLMHLTMSL